MPGVLTVYRWELRKLRAAEAHLPRARRGRGGADHLRHRARDPQRRTARRRLRPLRPRHRPGDPAGPAAVRLGLAVPADHRPGRRRHRRRRGPRPHPEDDPHPLGRAPAGLRRARRWRPSPTRSRRSRSAAPSPSSPGSSPPASTRSSTLSGTRVSASHGLGLVGASLLVYLLPILAVACIGLLLSTVFRNSAAAIVGTLMFSLLLQLIGILPGLGGLQPYLLSTQFQAWQGFLRGPGRLGADPARALGLRPLRGAGAGRGDAGLPAPRRGRRVARSPAARHAVSWRPSQAALICD